MATIVPRATVDPTRLTAAMRAASRFSKRTPALAANTAMFFVMRGAARDTPRTGIGVIDTELGVQVHPVINKNGKVSTNRRRRYSTSTFSQGKSSKSGVPFIALIISARAKTGSRYNQLTGGRFAIAQHPLKGVNPHNTSMVKSIMERVARKILAGRRSSIAYLASSILPIIRGLEFFIEPRYRRGATPLDSAARNAYRKSTEDKGAISPARPGGMQVYASADLLIGMKGKNSVAQNEAMHRIMRPVLQRNVNIEAEKTFRKVAEWEARDLQRQCRSIGAV